MSSSSLKIPTHMKGILLSQTGGPEVLEYKTDIPVPVPREGEVLIKNEYIGINYMDINIRSGLYPVPKPHILGGEAEGIIIYISPPPPNSNSSSDSTASPTSPDSTPTTSTREIQRQREGEAEETHDLKPGDRVVWLGTKGGAYAEYSTCPISRVYKLPAAAHKEVDTDTDTDTRDTKIKPGIAATTLAQGLSALTFIKKAYPAKKGDWILIQGVTSGVGYWLSRFLNDIGVFVIGTVGSIEKGQSVVIIEKSKSTLTSKTGNENENEDGNENEGGGRGGGGGVIPIQVEYLFSYKDERIVDLIMEITGGKGVSAVFDGVGKTTFDMGLRVLARDGTMVSYGNSSGDVVGFDIGRLLERNLRLMRPSVFGYLGSRDEFVGFVDELFGFIERWGVGAGMEVEALAGKVYLLEDVRKAHLDLEERRVAGKLLLKV